MRNRPGHHVRWSEPAKALVESMWRDGRGVEDICKALIRLHDLDVSPGGVRRLAMEKLKLKRRSPIKSRAPHAVGIIRSAEFKRKRHVARGERVGMIEPDFDQDLVEPLEQRLRR